MFGLLLLYALRHHRYRRFHILVRFWRPDWVRFREIFRIGTPIGLTVMAEVGMFAVAAVFMGWLGTDELAAHAVALQCVSLAFMVPLGLSMASTVRVGLSLAPGTPEGSGGPLDLHGAGRRLHVHHRHPVLTIPGVFTRLFLDPAHPENAVALAFATSYLLMAGFFQIADGAQVVAAHVLRGLSDTKIPMVVALFGYWCVGMPIAWYLAAPTASRASASGPGSLRASPSSPSSSPPASPCANSSALLDPRRMITGAKTLACPTDMPG